MARRSLVFYQWILLLFILFESADTQLYTSEQDGPASLPRNFSWVVDGKLCAMGFPYEEGNIRYLHDNNVGVLISLTEEATPDLRDFTEIRLVHLKVKDFTPPTIPQIQECMNSIDAVNEAGKAVGIHCYHGKGRTGTIIACYLVLHLEYTAEQAIRKTRELRPGSIETIEQEQMVHTYEKYIKS